MIMISIPMGNDPNWKQRYKEVKEKLEKRDYKVAPLHINKIFDKTPTIQYPVESISLVMMGNSMYRMALCDTVYFCKGWRYAPGCVIEHIAADKYGLNMIYEEDEDEN